MSRTLAQILERPSYGFTLHGTGCFLELNGWKITDNQWLKPGHEVVLEVGGLGRLVNTIAVEQVDGPEPATVSRKM